jgi:DNA-binding beta-propeller fold protein YncE
MARFLLPRAAMKTAAVLGVALLSLLAATAACTTEATSSSSSGTPGPADVPSSGGPAPIEVQAPALGTGDKTAESVTLTEIATASDRLRRPTALAFNPWRSGELWITNEEDNSMIIVFDAPTEARTSERRREAAMDHFLHKPMGIAFGAEETTFGSKGTFATCGESRNEMGGGDGAGNNFMGPALWTSDLSVFAKKNPIGLGSHIDMLHSSPLCMGITHEQGNVYWAFGGFDSTVHRYDFKDDHDVGMDDHSDGEIRWYGKGKFKRLENVPSHLAYRAADKKLFVADTGNSRIALLDTRSGKEAVNGRNPDRLAVNIVMVTHPSGMLLKDDLLYVADYENGRISAFNAAGEVVNYLDTGLAQSIGGLAMGPDDKLYFVDMKESRVLRIDAKN